MNIDLLDSADSIATAPRNHHPPGRPVRICARAYHRFIGIPRVPLAVLGRSFGDWLTVLYGLVAFPWLGRRWLIEACGKMRPGKLIIRRPSRADHHWPAHLLSGICWFTAICCKDNGAP